MLKKRQSTREELEAAADTSAVRGPRRRGVSMGVGSDLAFIEAVVRLPLTTARAANIRSKILPTTDAAGADFPI